MLYILSHKVKMNLRTQTRITTKFVIKNTNFSKKYINF